MLPTGVGREQPQLYSHGTWPMKPLRKPGGAVVATGLPGSGEAVAPPILNALAMEKCR